MHSVKAWSMTVSSERRGKSIVLLTLMRIASCVCSPPFPPSPVPLFVVVAWCDYHMSLLQWGYHDLSLMAENKGWKFMHQGLYSNFLWKIKVLTSHQIKRLFLQQICRIEVLVPVHSSKEVTAKRNIRTLRKEACLTKEKCPTFGLLKQICTCCK